MNAPESGQPPFRHVTVVGLGLIGGSLAMALKSAFPGIVLQGVDPDPEALQFALRVNCVDEVSRTLPLAFAPNHLVVLASHLSVNEAALAALAPAVAEADDVWVSDIGSCKARIVARGTEMLPGRFVGGHPLAGREKAGIAHASSLLFAGKTWLLCPDAQTPDVLKTRLGALLAGVGATVRELDPATHDWVMAYVSHFPQLYATLFANLLQQNKPGLLLAHGGGGMDDQLRLTGSPAAMWGEIFEHNRDNLLAALGQFQALLAEAGEALEKGQTPAMAGYFERANALYADWQRSRQVL